MLAPIHLHLVDRLAPKPGERWLDLATGTGAVAFLAARAGADTTGVDFAHSLIETARRSATDKGREVRFEVGNVEDLPFEDASFDVLSSSMGMIFAPDHEAVAREVARVCRAGGRLGFTAWKPETGFSPVSEKYRPEPDPDAGDSDEWAREEYVCELLGDSFELEFEHAPWRFAPEPGETLWQRLTFAVGPFKALAESLEGDERERYHEDFVRYVDGFGGEGVPGDYVLVLGTRK
jgi:SAM-dependent methyltransferase